MAKNIENYIVFGMDGLFLLTFASTLTYVTQVWLKDMHR